MLLGQRKTGTVLRWQRIQLSLSPRQIKPTHATLKLRYFAKLRPAALLRNISPATKSGAIVATHFLLNSLCQFTKKEAGTGAVPMRPLDTGVLQ